jgi:hypothetical protein
MGLPSLFLETKFFKGDKGDDITPFDGTFASFFKDKSHKEVTKQ